MRQTRTHLYVMKNDAAEATFLDALTCDLDCLDDSRKHEIYLLMQNVFFNVFKGSFIKDIISRLVVRVVTQENVLDGLGKMLSETFIENDEIMAVMVERPQKKVYIVVSSSLESAHERINDVV